MPIKTPENATRRDFRPQSGSVPIGEALSKNVQKMLRKFTSTNARDKNEKERRPDAISASFDQTCENIADWFISIANPLFKEVYANKGLMKEIKAYKNGQMGEDVNPEFVNFVKLYTRIQKFIRMVGNPERYHNKSGYPYGSVNLLASMDANESVAPKRKYPAHIIECMRSRIEEETAELGRIMQVHTAKPPHPQIEKRGKIVNELPAGMCNPNMKKDGAKTSSNPFGAGRPSDVDKDVHTTSWSRDQLVNTHMSKKNKEARK